MCLDKPRFGSIKILQSCSDVRVESYQAHYCKKYDPSKITLPNAKLQSKVASLFFPIEIMTYEWHDSIAKIILVVVQYTPWWHFDKFLTLCVGRGDHSLVSAKIGSLKSQETVTWCFNFHLSLYSLWHAIVQSIVWFPFCTSVGTHC